MPTQDTSIVKDKIISILKRNGPSLPVHLAKEINLSILFTSAFLSELNSEKRLKMSHLRVGSSPLYMIPGQESLMEKFSNHLKSKEKEAFSLLKERKILKDSEQNPPIRIALREIRDFAIPFRDKETSEIFWRFFNAPEEQLREKELPREDLPEKQLRKKEMPEANMNEKEMTNLQPSPVTPKEEERTNEVIKKSEKELNIFDKPKKAVKKVRKKTPQKENNFFNKVKEFLSEKSIELADVLTFNKNEIILRVKDQNREWVLIAYNKNRMNESDIIKASKKSAEIGLPYIVISNGGILKKTEELIAAIKNLHAIGKIKEDVSP